MENEIIHRDALAEHLIELKIKSRNPLPATTYAELVKVIRAIEEFTQYITKKEAEPPF